MDEIEQHWIKCQLQDAAIEVRKILHNNVQPIDNFYDNTPRDPIKIQSKNIIFVWIES